MPVADAALELAIVVAVMLGGFTLARAFDRSGASAMIAISVVGIVAGSVLPAHLQPSLGPVFLAIFLPALIFEAAWDASVPALRRSAVAIAVLAIPGVLFTGAVVAAAAVFSGALAWPAALVLGALLSATDPVSVLAVFRRLNLPRVLVTIVEGESIANDAMGLALVQMLVPLAIVTVQVPPMPVAVLSLLEVGGGGVLAGAIVALPIGLAMRSPIGTPGRIAATIAAAYVSYGAAAALGVSGILAAATAGIVLRATARMTSGAPATLAIDRAWDTLAMLSNAAVFALIGMTLRVERLTHEPLMLVSVVCAVVLARLVLAYVLVPLRGLTRFERTWRHAIALAGLRGGLSLVLAIGLPAGMPQAAFIRDATFAVVFVTLIVQGPLIAPLIRRLFASNPESATSGTC